MTELTYRSKPYEVEAWQYDKGKLERGETQTFPAWLIKGIHEGTMHFFQGPDAGIEVVTDNGNLIIRDGDWLVKRGLQFLHFTDLMFRAEFEPRGYRKTSVLSHRYEDDDSGKLMRRGLNDE